jgi:hypothetical protein
VTPIKTKPFVEPLTIAAVKKPLNATATPDGSCVKLLSGSEKLVSYGPHQFIDRPDFKPRFAYEIDVNEAKHSFHPSIPDTTIWGYDGSAPGPIFHATYGEAIMVRYHNNLPKNHVGFGIHFNRHTCTTPHGIGRRFPRILPRLGHVL